MTTEKVTIFYDCPHCNEELTVTYQTGEGFKLTCPECGKEIEEVN